MKLPKDQIEVAVLLVEKNVESCGFIIDDTLFVDNVGKTNNTICVLSRYTEHIFHTHPYNGFSYPSPQDIVKILKLRENPQVSVIFTKWGVWEFTCGKKQKIDDNFSENMQRFIKDTYDVLYPSRHSKLDDEILKIIIDCNYKIMVYLNEFDFDFEIYFIPWDDFFEKGFKII